MLSTSNQLPRISTMDKLESRTKKVEEIACSVSLLPPAPTSKQLADMLNSLRRRYPVRTTRLRGTSESTIEGALAKERALLISQGCPTEARVRSSFAACGAHSEVGAMLQWFCHSVVELMTHGADSVKSFPEEWEAQLRAATESTESDINNNKAGGGGRRKSSTHFSNTSNSQGSLRAHLFELQGFGVLFSFIWSQWAAVESQLGTLLAKEPEPQLPRVPVQHKAVPPSELLMSFSTDPNAIRPTPPYVEKLQQPSLEQQQPDMDAGEESITPTQCRAKAKAGQEAGSSSMLPAVSSPMHTSGPDGTVIPPAPPALSTARSPQYQRHAKGPEPQPATRSFGLSGVNVLQAPQPPPVPPRGRDRVTAMAEAMRARGPHTTVRPIPPEGLMPSKALVIGNASSNHNNNHTIGSNSGMSNESTTSKKRASAMSGLDTSSNVNNNKNYDKMEKQFRAQTLKKELGVQVIRNYGEERDVSDYVKQLDQIRASVLYGDD